jgi:hypothetical protein
MNTYSLLIFSQLTDKQEKRWIIQIQILYSDTYLRYVAIQIQILYSDTPLGSEKKTPSDGPATINWRIEDWEQGCLYSLGEHNSNAGDPNGCQILKQTRIYQAHQRSMVGGI